RTMSALSAPEQVAAWPHMFSHKRESKQCCWRQGRYMIRQKMLPNSSGRGNRREEDQARLIVTLATSMRHMADGNSKANRRPTRTVRSSIGSAPVWSADAPTTGDVYRFDLVPMISKEKISMAWAIIGRSVMTT